MAAAQPAESQRSQVAAPPPPRALEWDAPLSRRGKMRLRTLLALRWVAVAGQAAMLAMVGLVLHLPAPWIPCLLVISASVAFNVAIIFLARGRNLARDSEAAWQLAFDVVQLAVLLGFVGGLANPFAILLMAPPSVAAGALSTRRMLVIASLSAAAVLILYFWSLPLPWVGQLPILPETYRMAVAAALIMGILFTAGFAWHAAGEGARMELALAATEAVLAREQRLSALGGLAAAAAHELGTPLATIQVVAKELLRSSPADDPVAEDARLLLQQAQRCREILKNLSERTEDGDAVYARLGLAQLLNEVVEPYRRIGPTFVTAVEGPPGDFVPDVRRLPEMVHALAAFAENAADFALDEVRVTARFDDHAITIETRDDGPGFAPEILAKLGEPYVTSRPSGEDSPSHHQGMGLGFFIAKTLLERAGARVSFTNDEEYGGAVVTVAWPRRIIEAPDG
ncbi:MAG: ActS/PrrB/RegB family redox-sensitive histidine kinase [Caulobacteraceae bacterium]|nr:ActS/PrrB/RegB family redox-sensitive histidine kinase [Caulobacteraceae bacterium]